MNVIPIEMLPRNAVRNREFIESENKSFPPFCTLFLILIGTIW